MMHQYMHGLSHPKHGQVMDDHGIEQHYYWPVSPWQRLDYMGGMSGSGRKMDLQSEIHETNIQSLDTVVPLSPLYECVDYIAIHILVSKPF